MYKFPVSKAPYMLEFSQRADTNYYRVCGVVVFIEETGGSALTHVSELKSLCFGRMFLHQSGVPVQKSPAVSPDNLLDVNGNLW